MNVYKYFSYDDKVVLLEVRAESLLEADKILTLKTGIVPCKTSDIGVSIDFL